MSKHMAENDPQKWWMTDTDRDKRKLTIVNHLLPFQLIENE